jgi:TnpA family transposase
MTENIIMNIIPKLKQLDVNKLYLVEEAMNHCLAVQSLEKIKNEREIVKKYVQYETEISV